jgi:hypothetical protein
LISLSQGRTAAKYSSGLSRPLCPDHCPGYGCRTDVDRLLGSRCRGGLLTEAFVGGLAAEAAVGPMVVVEVLPLLELVVKELDVVDNDAFELAVELFGVEALAALDLAVEARGGGLDVDVPDAAVGEMPVERRLRSGSVGLDRLDPDRELVQQVVG